MALEPMRYAWVRIGFANTLSCMGCSFMMLLVVALIYKAATNQLAIPNAIYVGLALSVGLLLLAQLIVGSVPGKTFLLVAAARALFALLLKPFLFALASAFDDGNWVVAVILIGVAFIAAQPTVGFVRTSEESSVDLDRSAI